MSTPREPRTLAQRARLLFAERLPIQDEIGGTLRLGCGVNQ